MKSKKILTRIQKMTNKREVKGVDEAKKLLEKFVKKEKLTSFPFVDSGANKNKKRNVRAR